jgi:DNA-binding transcriptional LysR family regulator
MFTGFLGRGFMDVLSKPGFLVSEGKALQAQRVLPDDGLQPDLNHVYFEAVYRHGSIRKAATALHIASSALNRRVLDLEEEIGTPLFERLPRGVRLTQAGELFLAYVRRCALDLQQLKSQLEQVRGHSVGSVRIGVAESVTPKLLPGAVEAFCKAHPAVSFHITVDGPEGLGEALLQDTVDLILTHELLQHPGCVTLAAARHPLCAFVAPTHPLAQQTSSTLGECSQYPCALPDRTLAARRLLDLALEQASVRITPAVESNSVETLKAFARSGEAVCFSFHLGNTAETAGLVALELRNPHCADARLFLAARRGRTLPPVAAMFAEQLKVELEVNLALRLMSAV